MKRIITGILAFILILGMILPVSAAVANPITPVEPMYDYVNLVYARLEIGEDWGMTTCTGTITAKQLLPVKVIVRLQKLDGYWQTIKSWSATGTGSASHTGNYAVYSGYTYRVSVIGYVYDSNGNIIETATVAHVVDYPAD